MARNLMKAYEIMLKAYGKQHWWPANNGLQPKGWEVCVGAVLTQNTSWSNVERALSNLSKAGCLTVEDMAKMEGTRLAKLIRPAGYFNQKAERLKNFAEFVSSFGSFGDFKNRITREELLKIKGIGEETTDSMLLYACGRTEFVVDAYTGRVFERLGFLKGDESYNWVKVLFEKNLPKNERLFNEYHALIVRHAKDVCRKKPLCSCCCLRDMCSYPKSGKV